MKAKEIKRLVGYLMTCLKACRPFDPSTSSGPLTISAASENRYNVASEGTQAIRNAAKYAAPLADSYPIDELHRRFMSHTVEACDSSKYGASAAAYFAEELKKFDAALKAQDEWEVVFAVRGISLGPAPLSIGRCTLQLMTDAAIKRWGQRCRTGMYDPPASAPSLDAWTIHLAELRNKPIAVVRTPAIDVPHAQAKARLSLEDALNLLRYGILSFQVDWSNPPQVGFEPGVVWQSHAISMCINKPGLLSSSSGGGESGVSYEWCQIAPAWTALEKIIAVDVSERSELQTVIVSALQWVGLAALTPVPASRLVALVTALEVLLIDDFESLGKKRKLSQRAPKLAAVASKHPNELSGKVSELYELRSSCVHYGTTQVENDDLDLACKLLAYCIRAMLEEPRFGSCRSLSDVLAILEPAEPDPPFCYII